MSEISRDLRLVEAMLFAAAEPVSEAHLARQLPEGTDVPALVAELRALYDGRGVQVVRVGNGWAFRTAPDLAPALRLETTTTRKLSRAAIETLSIIAYHQPVTRAEIEDIRGVSQSKGTLDVLLEAGWIKPGRRRLTPGRPVTWLTTPEFLDHFGLENIKDLPGIEELKSAGLLDARPAIQAFRGIVDPDADVEEGEDEDDLAGDDLEEIDLARDETAGDETDGDILQEDHAPDEAPDDAPDAPSDVTGEIADQPDDDEKIVRQAR